MWGNKADKGGVVNGLVSSIKTRGLVFLNRGLCTQHIPGVGEGSG